MKKNLVIPMVVAKKSTRKVNGKVRVTQNDPTNQIWQPWQTAKGERIGETEGGNGSRQRGEGWAGTGRQRRRPIWRTDIGLPWAWGIVELSRLFPCTVKEEVRVKQPAVMHITTM